MEIIMKKILFLTAFLLGNTLYAAQYGQVQCSQSIDKKNNVMLTVHTLGRGFIIHCSELPYTPLAEISNNHKDQKKEADLFIGKVACSYKHNKNDGYYGYIDHLYVDPLQRHNGYGAILFNQALSVFKDSRYKVRVVKYEVVPDLDMYDKDGRWRLLTDEEYNLRVQQLISFYSKLGGKIISEGFNPIMQNIISINDSEQIATAAAVKPLIKSKL
jgi:hypothetical protein